MLSALCPIAECALPHARSVVRRSIHGLPVDVQTSGKDQSIDVSPKLGADGKCEDTPVLYLWSDDLGAPRARSN